MHRESYGSYADYLRHQVAGRLDPGKHAAPEKVAAFAASFRGFGMPASSDCLCVGARFGEEVEAGLACFRSCVGVDLVALPPLVVEGDMHDLRFADGSFDVVYTNVIDHAYDLPRAFSEMARVLRPGGLLAADTFLRRGLKRLGDGSLGHYASVICEDAGEVVSACGLRLERRESIRLPSLEERFLFRKDGPGPTAP